MSESDKDPIVELLKKASFKICVEAYEELIEGVLVKNPNSEHIVSNHDKFHLYFNLLSIQEKIDILPVLDSILTNVRRTVEGRLIKEAEWNISHPNSNNDLFK